MSDAYAQIYDLENRLRFFLHDKLSSKYGAEYFSKLTTKVRTNIEIQKNRAVRFVTDPRKGELDFAQFSDLKRIFLSNEEFIPDGQTRAFL